MLLKSLEIKDFRQFKGKQNIVFADDQQKNVTIIMGDNGTGKTTLAQAFTWCLYGETDFDDKILLCKATSMEMLPGSDEKVYAKLELTHKKREYTISSEQLYSKDTSGNIKAGQRKFTIMYKQEGQMESVKESQLAGRMKEILPQELARYFFFDGERISVMSKRLSQGKGKDFADAVRSLLGLDAFTAAIRHLKKTVKEYDKQYDTHSDIHIGKYNKKISELDVEIERLEQKLIDIDNEESPVTEKIRELQAKIEKNKMSAEFSDRKSKLNKRLDSLKAQKNRNITELLSIFKTSHDYFTKKMMENSITLLKDAKKIDKSVPSINAKTLKYLLQRGRCICGTEIIDGNSAYMELSNLFNYVPPKSIGDSMAELHDKCIGKLRNSEIIFDNFIAKYKDICSFDVDYEEVKEEIMDIEKHLLGMDDVGKLQSDLMRYETQLRDLKDDCISFNGDKRIKEKERIRAETERDKLTLKDDNNRRIMTYKAYAQYMYDTLSETYKVEEKRVREELERVVNKIFNKILGEGFSLSLNDKYDVQVSVDNYGGYAETSTAQNISIIFAFIAGVIQMARESQDEEGSLLVSEPYPLVMDAPLSAFDRTRIQQVCDVLPKIAEQVIIFIKDTDGEIAEDYLGSHIGKQLTFHTPNNSKIETYIL